MRQHRRLARTRTAQYGRRSAPIGKKRGDKRSLACLSQQRSLCPGTRRMLQQDFRWISRDRKAHFPHFRHLSDDAHPRAFPIAVRNSRSIRHLHIRCVRGTVRPQRHIEDPHGHPGAQPRAEKPIVRVCRHRFGRTRSRAGFPPHRQPRRHTAPKRPRHKHRRTVPPSEAAHPARSLICSRQPAIGNAWSGALSGQELSHQLRSCHLR